MRLGVFSVFDTYPELDLRRATERPEATLRLLRTAEELGYDTFWAGEHHVRPSGAMPSPPVWLSAAARETHRIRLGSMVSVLPLHAPRELAEQFALLDRLSEGRLEIGLGTGYDPLEYGALGHGYDDRHRRFDESLPEFERALIGAPLPVAPDLGGPVTLNVRTAQQPRPPIWVAAARSAGIRSVAERGHGLAVIPYATLAHIDDLEAKVRLYRDHLPPGVEPRVLAGFHVYAGPNRTDAMAALQRFLDSRPTPSSPAYLEHLREHPELRTATGLDRSGLLLFGSVQELARRAGALEAIGVTEIAGIFDFGDLSWSDVDLSLAGFMDAARPTGTPFVRDAGSGRLGLSGPSPAVAAATLTGPAGG